MTIEKNCPYSLCIHYDSCNRIFKNCFETMDNKGNRFHVDMPNPNRNMKLVQYMEEFKEVDD